MGHKVMIFQKCESFIVLQIDQYFVLCTNKMSDKVFAFECNSEWHCVMIPYRSINTSIFNGTLEIFFLFLFGVSNTFVYFNLFSLCSNIDSGFNISLLSLEGASVHCFTFNKLNCLRLVCFSQKKICHIWVILWG